MLRLSSCLLPRLSVRALSAAAPASAANVKKDALMKLRKRTGYSYVNVRKAVDKFGVDNLAEAEKWLRELAAKEGWAKAEKLGARITSQGLIGAEFHKNVAAVVELNCETDFVARGDVFKELLEEVTLAVVDAAKGMTAPSDRTFAIHGIDAESTVTRKNRSVKEAIAMTVGKLGENITVARAQLYIAPEGVDVFARSHPRDGNDNVEMGRFISMIGMQRTENATQFPSDKLAAQLCQHVIGMQPKTLGTPNKKDTSTEKKEEVSGEKDELNDFFSGATTQMDEDETQLLRQSFMLNPKQSVYEYLQSHGADVVSFARLELGVKDEDA